MMAHLFTSGPPFCAINSWECSCGCLIAETCANRSPLTLSSLFSPPTQMRSHDMTCLMCTSRSTDSLFRSNRFQILHLSGSSLPGVSLDHTSDHAAGWISRGKETGQRQTSEAIVYSLPYMSDTISIFPLRAALRLPASGQAMDDGHGIMSSLCRRYIRGRWQMIRVIPYRYLVLSKVRELAAICSLAHGSESNLARPVWETREVHETRV